MRAYPNHWTKEAERIRVAKVRYIFNSLIELTSSINDLVFVYKSQFNNKSLPSRICGHRNSHMG